MTENPFENEKQVPCVVAKPFRYAWGAQRDAQIAVSAGEQTLPETLFDYATANGNLAPAKKSAPKATKEKK